MVVSFPTAIPIIMIVMFSMIGTLLIFTFPILLLGRKWQRKVDQQDRELLPQVMDEKNEWRRKYYYLENNIIYLDNLGNEFCRQIQSFMRRNNLNKSRIPKINIVRTEVENVR